MKLVYLLGLSCVGKSSLAKQLIETNRHWGRINVGEEFRKRYPPEYFEGKGAMDKTENEAQEIFRKLYKENSSKKVILVEGQPRLKSQIPFILGHNPEQKIFIWIHTDRVNIEERIEVRFKNDEPSKELSLKRLENDSIQMYDVIFELMNLKQRFATIENDDFNKTLKELEWTITLA